MRFLRAHQGSVRSVAFSPDGRLLASGGKDRRVYLWDVASGEARQIFRGKSGFIPVVAFSPDGSYLAWGNGDSAYLSDLAAGKAREPLAGHFNVVTAVSFSADSGHLVVCSQQFVGTNHAGEVRAWNVETGAEESDWRERLPAHLRQWEAHYPAHLTPRQPLMRPAWSVRLGGNPSALAVGTDGQGLVVLGWPGLEERAALRQAGARAIVFRPDGSMLANVTESKLATLWTLGGKKPRKWQLRGHDNTVKCLDFSPDGRLLATGGKDGLVIFWDPESRQERARFNWQVGPVHGLAFAPDGMTMAVAGDEGIALCDVDIA